MPPFETQSPNIDLFLSVILGSTFIKLFRDLLIIKYSPKHSIWALKFQGKIQKGIYKSWKSIDTNSIVNNKFSKVNIHRYMWKKME